MQDYVRLKSGHMAFLIKALDGDPASVTPPLSHLHPMEMGRVLQGQTLGHYELIEFVGGGGMGAVFRALDTMLNRIVAVKVLSHDQSDDDGQFDDKHGNSG